MSWTAMALGMPVALQNVPYSLRLLPLRGGCAWFLPRVGSITAKDRRFQDGYTRQTRSTVKGHARAAQAGATRLATEHKRGHTAKRPAPQKGKPGAVCAIRLSQAIGLTQVAAALTVTAARTSLLRAAGPRRNRSPWPDSGRRWRQ